MTDSDPPIFSRRMTGILVTSGVVSLVCAFAAGTLARSENAEQAVAANGYSRSAIGHHAFVELLREMKLPVITSRARSVERAGEDGAVVVLEPNVTSGGATHASALAAIVREASEVLLVLPKWRGFPSPTNETEVEKVTPIPIRAIEGVLVPFVRGVTVVPAPVMVDAWTGDFPRPTLTQPQLLRSGALKPILSNAGQILVGETEVDGTHLVVVSDPDIFENHGLHAGDNAALALKIIDRVRSTRWSPIVIDETIHGFVRPTSFFRTLFEFPLVVATVQFLLAAVLALWAGARRFGSPAPLAPPFEVGKAFLIENTASLLAHAGHHGESLRRILDQVTHEAARQVPADLRGDRKTLVPALARLGMARGTTDDFAKLTGEIGAARRDRKASPDTFLELARRLQQWAREFDPRGLAHKGRITTSRTPALPRDAGAVQSSSGDL